MKSEKKTVVYTAYSKFNFYLKEQISKYVLSEGQVPLNPFANWGYFMSDTVERDVVRNANFNLLRISDEIWVFGIISNGVAAEIDYALSNNIPLRYFSISENGKRIKGSQSSALQYEADAFLSFPDLKKILGFG